MVTTQEIESLGWKHKGTAKNGGSKLFELNGFTLFSNPVLNKSCNYELTTKHLHTLLYLQTFRLNKHYSNELKSRQIKIKL